MTPDSKTRAALSEGPPPDFAAGAGCRRLDRNRYRVDPGVVLFREGEPGAHAYWIEHGRVDLTRDIGAIPTILAIAMAGEIIGEMALIDGAPRSATATASTETVLTAIPAAKFQSHLETLDPLAQALLRKFTRIIRSSNDLIAQHGSYGPIIGQ